MFTHRTILSLRRQAPRTSVTLPVFGRFEDHHFARNVMEAKQHLLRCLHLMNPKHFPTPDLIVIDAEHESADIKTELERWMRKHSRLSRTRIVFATQLSWMRRLWQKWTLARVMKAEAAAR
jgi:hypothetical protein